MAEIGEYVSAIHAHCLEYWQEMRVEEMHYESDHVGPVSWLLARLDELGISVTPGRLANVIWSTSPHDGAWRPRQDAKVIENLRKKGY